MPELGELSKILKRKVGNKNYFIGKLSSDIAKKVTFVPVVEDSDTYLNQILKDGYQRPGKKSRMNQFKKYLGLPRKDFIVSRRANYILIKCNSTAKWKRQFFNILFNLKQLIFLFIQ